MRPLQVWLPTWDPTVSSDDLRRDIQRAQEEWLGESTIWLMPSVEKVSRWEEEERRQERSMAIPAETFNRLDVLLIGGKGEIHGSTRFRRVLGGSIDGLLDDWLNVGRTDESAFRLHAVSPEIRMIMPVIQDGSVRYALGEVTKAGPLGTFPASFDMKARKIRYWWPPDDRKFPRTVSPNAESTARYGDFVPADPVDESGFSPFLKNVNDASFESLHTIDRWPGSLENLLPFGGGLDATLGQLTMAEIAELSRFDLDDAIRQAGNHSTGLINEISVRLLYSWFLPFLARNGEEAALWELEGKYGISGATLREVLQLQECKELLLRPQPATCCVGVLGLLWALLLDRLRSGETFISCEACGRIVANQRNKRFCGKHDNAECWRNRRKVAKRRERSRKRE